MSEKLPTHFLHGLHEYPEKRQKDVAELRKWYDKQGYFPIISDDYMILFLHACYFNMDKAKRSMEHYFTIRTNNPALFSDRDIMDPKIKNVFDYANLVRLPKKSPKGHEVLLYSVYDPECTKFVFAEAVKAFCMFNDYRISIDGLAEGYVVLFDMKGCTIGHFARVTLPAMRAYMQYIQEAHPARLKEIHILNTAAFINHVMRLVQPLINSDLMNMLKFHRHLPPEELIPLEMLPVEYGGQAGHVREMHIQQRQEIERPEYREWLISTGKLVCDDSKRPKKKSFGFFSGPDID